MKTYKEDLSFIYNKLKNKEKFAFSKYSDGEYSILIDKLITNCDGWTYDPKIHQEYKNELLKSFQFNHKGYYVGIMCPCCVNIKDVDWMRNNVKVDKDHLTWANLFVNSNYEFFKTQFIKEFENHDIIIVANSKATIENLPFKNKIEEHIKITDTAWKDNFDLLDILPKKEYKDKLFLFCAGPLGNMLSYRMWESNKSNIYLDIGSTLNPYLVGNNRRYLKGKETLYRTCIW